MACLENKWGPIWKGDVEFVSTKRDAGMVDCPSCASSSSRRKERKFQFQPKIFASTILKKILLLLKLEGKYYLKKAFDEQNSWIDSQEQRSLFYLALFFFLFLHLPVSLFNSFCLSSFNLIRSISLNFLSILSIRFQRD